MIATSLLCHRLVVGVAVAFGVVSFLGVAHGAGGEATGSAADPLDCRPINERAVHGSFDWGGDPAGNAYRRPYCLVPPPGHEPGEAIPLIVALHGHHQNPLREARDLPFHRMCDGRWGMKCQVVYPASCLDLGDAKRHGTPTTNDCIAGQDARWERVLGSPERVEWDARDDEGFVHEMIRRIPDVDHEHIHVTGASNGGKFIYRLLCSGNGGPLYESYSGVMTVNPSDNLRKVGEHGLCHIPPDGPVPALAHVHGTADPVFDFDFDTTDSVAVLHGYDPDPPLARVERHPGFLPIEHFIYGDKVKVFLLEGGTHHPSEDYVASTMTVLLRDFLAPMWGGHGNAQWDLQAYNTRCLRNRCPDEVADDAGKAQWAGFEFRLTENVQLTQISVNQPLARPDTSSGNNVALWSVDDERLVASWALEATNEDMEFWESTDVTLPLQAGASYRLVGFFRASAVRVVDPADSNWQPWAPGIEPGSVRGVRSSSATETFPDNVTSNEQIFGLITFRYLGR